MTIYSPGDYLNHDFTNLDFVNRDTAARNVLGPVVEFTIVDVSGDVFITSRIDDGEASCVAAAREADAPILLTDDDRALPELREAVDADVALLSIFLRALVNRVYSPRRKPVHPSREL